MAKIILIQDPNNRETFYNIAHLVKIRKEATATYLFTFVNGENLRISDIDVINKVRENTDIRF